MDCRNSPFYRRCGYLLVEALVVLLLFLTALGLAMPRFWDWQEEKELDMAAQQLAGAIRQAEMAVKSRERSNDSDMLTFRCGPENGRVTYNGNRSGRVVPPRGTLPANVVCDDLLSITFRSDGFAGSDSSQYKVHLATKDKKYRRTVVVEMYTGRVRVSERSE